MESMANIIPEVLAEMDPANGTPPAPESPPFKLLWPRREDLVDEIARHWYRQGSTPKAITEDLVRRHSDWRNATPEELTKLVAEAEEVVKQARQQQVQQRLEELDEAIGPRYRNATMDNYHVQHDGQQAVVDAIRDYGKNIVERINAGVGVVLNGPSGVGKDHLLVCLARHAIRAGATVSWKNGQTLLGTFRDRFSERHPVPESELIDQFAAAHVLVLSDPVPPKGELSDYSESILYRIVDARYIMMRPTWCSMNVSGPEEADRRLGAPIVDRLRHGALCLSCDWPSYRVAGTWSNDKPQ
jgi:DNA replication protein DnaC